MALLYKRKVKQDAEHYYKKSHKRRLRRQWKLNLINQSNPQWKDLSIDLE
jgi:predicted GIY-YIG superfamily endonuclease